MIEIDKFILSMKCSRLKRFIKVKKSWIDIFDFINGTQIVHILHGFGDAFIFKCDISKTNISCKMFSIHFSVLYNLLMGVSSK